MARLHTYAQHFLSGPKLVAELVGHSNIRKNDTVYDLGAGSGVISAVLARRAKKVIAVENEPQALKKLRANLGDEDNVTIVKSDILDLPLPSSPYKIFSNIPFSLSASVVRKFTETDRPPMAMYLIVQKQFARKLTMGDDHFTSQLGAQLGPRFMVKIRRPLKRTDFTPPPGVDTVLLEIKLRDEPLIPESQAPGYVAFVGRCFAEQKFFSQTKRVESGIKLHLTPSQLTLEQWCALWNNVKK